MPVATKVIGAKKADLARQFAQAVLECERRGIAGAERQQWVENFDLIAGAYHGTVWTYLLPSGRYTPSLSRAIADWASEGESL